MHYLLFKTPSDNDIDDDADIKMVMRNGIWPRDKRDGNNDYDNDNDDDNDYNDDDDDNADVNHGNGFSTAR